VARAAEAATTLALLAIGAGAAAIATTYPPQARLIPLIIGLAAVAVALIQLLGQAIPVLRPLAGRPAEADGERTLIRDRRHVVRSLVIVGALAGLFALVAAVGIVIGTPLFVFLTFALLARVHLALAAAAGAAALGITYGVFVALMELPWAGGLLG